MTTEEQIIYTILNTVRSGEFNLDEPIGERLLRNYLKTHRASNLAKFYESGLSIHDECFQSLKELIFENVQNKWTCINLPKIIPFKMNAGIRLYKNDLEIPVVNEMQWRLNKKGRFTKNHPSVKFNNNNAELYLGQLNNIQQLDDDFSGSELNMAVQAILLESKGKQISLQGSAVLLDPDDSSNYDFTTSPYPFPNERIDMLINSVTARELNIFIQMKNDDIGNKFSNETDNPQSEEF